MTPTFSIAEAVEMAIQTEVLGKEFYTRAAAESEGAKADDRIVKLFADLAGAEVKHAAKFREIKDSLKTPADADPATYEEAQAFLRSMVESEFFLGSRKGLTDLAIPASRREVLQHALSFEKETLIFYYGLRDMVARGEAALDRIIAEEKTHVVRIQNLLDESRATGA